MPSCRHRCTCSTDTHNHTHTHNLSARTFMLGENLPLSERDAFRTCRSRVLDMRAMRMRSASSPTTTKGAMTFRGVRVQERVWVRVRVVL
jgi:hypothetical protein